jgi:hypothetical protein
VARRPRWCSALSYARLRVRRHDRHALAARLVMITPLPEVDLAGAAALWANLAGTLSPSRCRRAVYGTPHVLWQYQWAGPQLSISVWRWRCNALGIGMRD